MQWRPSRLEGSNLRTQRRFDAVGINVVAKSVRCRGEPVGDSKTGAAHGPHHIRKRRILAPDRGDIAGRRVVKTENIDGLRVHDCLLANINLCQIRAIATLLSKPASQPSEAVSGPPQFDDIVALDRSRRHSGICKMLVDDLLYPHSTDLGPPIARWPFGPMRMLGYAIDCQLLTGLGTIGATDADDKVVARRAHNGPAHEDAVADTWRMALCGLGVGAHRDEGNGHGREDGG